MHSGIKPHTQYVLETDLDNFSKFDFVFISVDSSNVRHMIATGLAGRGVPFIDVGLGLKRVENSLIGTVRTTVSTGKKNDHLPERIGSEDPGEKEYGKNIQIADLNCLNASLAVIRWKKHIGFYQPLKQEHNILFFTGTNRVINEDYPA